MFEKTLALSTNPFDPKLPAPLPANLGGDPIRLDQHDELNPLFCWKLPGLSDGDRLITQAIFGVGGGDKALSESIVIIRGGRGTGKTSFASHIKRKVLLSSSPKGNWHSDEMLFLTADQTPNPTVLRSKLDELKSSVRDAMGINLGGLFLFLDNVPTGGLPQVVEFFEEFKSLFRVFLVTTEDQSLKQDDLDWFAPRIVLAETYNVSAEDVANYVYDRVKLFRSPKRVAIDEVSALFPFAVSALPDLLGGASANHQPLRVMNRRLSRKVEERHQQLCVMPAMDPASCPAADLLMILIR